MASSSESPSGSSLDDVLEQLEALEESVDAPEERREVRKAMRLVHRLPHGRAVGRVVTEFTGKDKGEAFVGSVVVGLPMLVEDGVFEIGAYLAETPALFAINLAFAASLVVGILYVADFREVRITDPYFGIVPRRPLWVLLIAFGTAAALMTLWGRIAWNEPWVNLCQVSVVATAMAIGGSLGDIVPGED